VDASGAGVEAVEVVLPCTDLDASLAFFTGRLGFRVEALWPADDPAEVVLAGPGLRLCLRRGASGPPAVLRVACRDPVTAGGGARELVAPGGTRIELVPVDPPLELPPLRPELVLSRARDATFSTGRAGMLYRDLLPGRLGGRFVASLIRIPAGGPVPDQVHFHRVRFQLIHCCAGWVRLVYEDQGPPFVLQAGDCVLQPPEIRHRVLECSPGLEVVEVACPAVHETRFDHALALPNSGPRPERTFAGQRFVHHRAAAARWREWSVPGFEARDTGLAAATDGLVGARVVRSAGPSPAHELRHGRELSLTIVQRGVLTFAPRVGAVVDLEAGDAFAVPAGAPYRIAAAGAVELLEVCSPA
jgi:quercetin dioxygenase-like cupin family protein